MMKIELQDTHEYLVMCFVLCATAPTDELSEKFARMLEEFLETEPVPVQEILACHAEAKSILYDPHCTCPPTLRPEIFHTLRLVVRDMLLRDLHAN